MLHGLWNLLGPEIKPISPALADGFLFTAPPGKPILAVFKIVYFQLVLDNSFYPCNIDWSFSSFQFSRSVVSDSLRPHESQHTRPPCPSPSPRVHSNSRPLSRWCHPAISCSVVAFSSCPQSLPASESFPMSQLFAWGGQSTEALAMHYFAHVLIYLG